MKPFRTLIAGAMAMLVGALFFFGLLQSTQALAVTGRDAPTHSQPTALSAAAAVTMTLTPAKDTTIFEGVPNSGGASALLFTGFTNDAKERRTLLLFDLSQVPTNTQVISATLVLNVSKSRATPATPFALHRLLGDWGEAASSGGGGQGSPAKIGDSTWEFAFFNTTTWNNSGGDFAAPAQRHNKRWWNWRLSLEWGATGWPTCKGGSARRRRTSAGYYWGWKTRRRPPKQIIAKESTNASNRPRLILTFSGSISETQTSTLYLPLVQQ